MPTYNRADRIQIAINSVLQQGYDDFELIIIDDCSTDNTFDVVYSNYKNEIEQNKIIYLKNEKNSGASYSRNVGLKMAQYPWIAYLDSDNYLSKNFLQEFANAIQNSKSHLFYCQEKWLSSGRILGDKFDFDELCKNNFIDMGAFVHHKSFVKKYGGFNTAMKRLVDWELIIRYTSKENPIFIEKPLVYYSDFSDYPRIGNTISYEDSEIILEQTIKKCQFWRNLKLSTIIKKNFSITDDEDRRHKIVTLGGIRIKIRKRGSRA